MATTLTIGASPEEPALTSPPPGIDPQPEIASSAFNASPIPDLPEVDPVLNQVVQSNDPIEDKVKMLDLWRDDVLRASKLSDDYSAKKDAIIKLADEDVNVARGALMKNHFEQKAREAFPTIESRDRFMRDFNKYGLNADAYPDGLSTNPMHKEFIQGIKDDSDKLFGNGKASWDLNLATDAGFEILRGKAHETGDGKTLVTGQMRDAPPDGNNAIDGGSPLAALLTGKSADTFLADPKDSKGWNTYNPTFEVDTATPEDIKTETDKVQAELDGIPAKRAELERISRETIEASKSQPFVEGGGMTISPLAVMERQAAELAIKEKSLKTRLANLEKSGKAFLTNERIAAHIRNTPELMSLIPDKGVITRILNGAENMVMDFNVVGEQVGLPWMKGSLAGAAEAKTLKGQIGTGMEQSEFAGDPWSRIKLGVADNAAQTAMQLGLGGSSSAALTYGSMWLSSYGQALTQAEQQIQALRLSGDFEGARKAEENKQLFAIGTAVNDTAWEMAGGPASSMMLSKKALARPFLHAAIDPFVEAGEEIGTSITGAGLGLNNLIGQSSGIQGSDLVVAGFTAMGSAGFQAGISRKLRHLASAPAQMTPEQQAKNEILERVIKEMGVTGNITPPNVKSQRADTENPTTSTMGPDGKITVNLNPMWVHQPEGSQNWTIQDDGIRQRAFQAGLKTDFPTKEEADAFAQTVHQHIFEASVDGQVGDAITQDQVNAQKTLVQSAFQSVINKRPELRMDDLYSRFLIAMEGVQSNPSKGTEPPAPATQPPAPTEPPKQEAPAPATADQTAVKAEAPKFETWRDAAAMIDNGINTMPVGPAIANLDAAVNHLKNDKDAPPDVVKMQVEKAERRRKGLEHDAELKRIAEEKGRNHFEVNGWLADDFGDKGLGHVVGGDVLVKVAVDGNGELDPAFNVDQQGIFVNRGPGQAARIRLQNKGGQAPLIFDEAALKEAGIEVKKDAEWVINQNLPLRLLTPEAKLRAIDAILNEMDFQGREINQAAIKAIAKNLGVNESVVEGRVNPKVIKQEATAPATADQTAASTEAVNASQESSPPAQAPEASPSAPVGETSIPATAENATARDATKPEQMTPEESYEAYTTAKELAPNLADMPKTKKQIREGIAIAENSGIKDPELQKMFMDSAKAETAQFAGPYIRVQRIRLIEEALEEQKPVSTAAVDTYGITLPEGYAKQGDLYVYSKPSEAPATPPLEAKLQEGRDATKPEQMTPEEFEKMRGEIIRLYDESSMPPKSEAQKKAEFKVQMLEGELKKARTLEGGQARGVRRSRGAVKTEADLQVELDAARSAVAQEKEVWSSERTTKTQKLWTDLQANHPDAVSSGLVYQMQYEGRDEVGNKVGLPSSGKDLVRAAANEKKPVSAEAVDTYNIKLPEGYTKQGDLYVYSKPSEAPAPPTQEAKLQAGRQAIKKQAAPKASQPATKGRPPAPGQEVSFMQPGGVVTGKYIGPSTAGMSKVQVGDSVEHVRNGNIKENTNGVTLFQTGSNETTLNRMSDDERQLEGANMGRAMEMLGASLYAKNASGTIGKEVFQNAVDAVMKNESGKPKTIFYGQPDTSHFVVADTGSGMNPEIIIDKFLRAFVSGKDVGAGGGFGLAKLAFLGSPEAFKIISVGIDPDGRKVKTTLEGTGKSFLHFNEHPPKIRFKPDSMIELAPDFNMYFTYDIPADTQTGTAMEFGINDAWNAVGSIDNAIGYIDGIGSGAVTTAGSGYRANGDDLLRELGYSSRSDDEGIQSRATNKKPYGVIHSFSTPNADVDILAREGSRIEKTTYPYVAVLNRSIFQFKTSFNTSSEIALPEGIAINIKPKVRAGTADYPFTTNREAVTDDIRAQISRFFAEAGGREMEKLNAKYKDALKSATPIEGTGKVFLDAGSSVPESVMSEVASSPSVNRALSDVTKIQDAILKMLSKKYGKDFQRATFAGLLTGARAYGVHFGKPHSSEPTSIYHDIWKEMDFAYGEFETHRENDPDVKELSADDQMRYLYDTFLTKVAGVAFHEALHQTVNSEGESLARELTFKAGDIVDAVVYLLNNTHTQNEINTTINDLLRQGKYLETFSDSQKAGEFVTSQGGYDGYAMAEQGSENRGGEGAYPNGGPSRLSQSSQEQGNTIRGHIDTPLGNLGHALITLTSRRDGSTLLHEFIHGLGNLEIATGNGKTESLLQVILGDKSNAFHAWAMEGSEKMTDPVEAFRHTHERIAEGFEEWLRTGALPAHKNKGMLRQAFETIRDAMKQIVGDMIGRGVDRRYIPIGTKLPAAALEGYESLFALLDSDNNGKEQNPQPTLGTWDHVKSNSETSEANLYPLTKRGEYGREPLSAAELEYLARNNGLIGPDATNDEAAAVVADLAAQATRNAAAFNQGIALNQSENEVVAADKAKQLIDIATAKLMFMQSVKNDGKVPTLEQWKADLAKTGSHVFDGLSDAAMSLIYQGATMNISSTQANNVRALIQSAMLGANETVTLNEKDEYVRAITEAASMVKPGAKRAMQLNAKRASEATSAAQLNAAMNSALKIVGGEARVETRMQSERLRGLMAGYRAGNKSASQLKAILAEMKSMMLPVIKSSDVGASTKSFVNAVINVFDSATKGFDPSSILNTLDQAVVAIDKIGFDKANAAKANFTRGLKIGQRTQAARSEAVAKVLIDELKTVDGITPNEAARVVKMIRDAKTDLQLNRSVWKALLLFQDKRVAQAYDLATTRQEGIKRNLNQGKFGRLSDDVRKFAAFEAWHIPQHMLSQFSTLAGVLASNEAVISLDGVRTQVATQNQQIEAWLEANPPEETVRAPSDAMAKAFDEAMERFNIERDFDEAKNAMDRDKFIASLRELGESEEGAEEAARIQEHWKNFELFKNADKLDLLSLNNREMRGLVNSFRNYNAGIITGFIGRKAAEYRQKQFEEPFVSVLASGLRHIMKLDADKKLDVQGDFDRSVSIVDHTKRLAGWFFGFDRLSRTKIAQSKIGFTGSIEQQIRESGIYNLDSLFETQQWINRNITKQYTDMQADGIFNRMRILNIKDSAGKTIADYHLGFDNVSHYEGDHVTGNPALRKAYQQQFMPGNLNLGAGWNVVAKTPLGIGEKLSNIKNRRNQRMSRWIGFAMMQRQREANGMDGNYVDYVIGEKQHVRTGALDDRAGQIDDAKALMEVMKAAGVVSAPTFKQIAAILPADAHAAIALADRIFDHTGQWTYYLNQLEREAPLPMPVNYFPIQSYEDNASVEASMGSLGFELRGGVVEGQPDNMRAAARHARLNTKLKMANVNFFNVVESSVGKAAADMAATPVLKMVNNSFGEFKRKGLFTGASHNVAEEVRKAMLESGLRLAHPILGDAGVSHTIRGLVSQLLAQKSLAQAMRPLREVVGNMATNVLAGKFPATYRGWTARNVPGGNQFWDKLMVDLKAPTAMRSGPEAVNGIMQDMTLGIEDMLNHEHIPGFFAAIGKEIRHKRPQERSLIGRLQSHLLARVSRAAIKGLVTAGENPIIWPQWTGHFMDSIKDQTGAEFDRAKYEAGGYTADQLSIAVTTSEKGISDFMAQSARGGGRLAAMVPLNIDQRNAFLNSMMYQLTSFIGAQSNASRFAYKALARSPVGSQASNKAIATIGGLLVGNMVVNSAGTILAQAMKAGLDLGKIDFGGDDEEEKARRRAKSLAIHEFEETRDNALFLNGAREGANFWAVMGLRSMFSLRFGGASAIARLGAATALETAWMMAGDVQDYLTERGVPAGGWKERGGYNPYRDNVTFESTAWAAAFAYKRIAPFVPFISMDEKVDRAWQSSNALSVATTFGPTNALLSTLADMSRDVGNVMDGSLGRAGSAADFLLNSLMIANAFPIYPTVRPFTNEAAKNETIGNESFKETIFDKRAEQAGRAYAENPTKENEKRLAALPPDSMPIANRWIEKTMILNNASTVPGEPAKSRMLAHSLHSIESYKEKERHIELTNQYYKMKKAGVRGEFVNAIQQLRDSGKWGDTFGSKGDSSDFAQEMLKYDRETQRGEVPLEAYGSFY